jgi:hypothetical protein
MTEETQTTAPVAQTLEELTATYQELYQKEVPVNKKNNIEWITEKIKEFKPAEVTTEATSPTQEPEQKKEPEPKAERPTFESVPAIKEFYGILDTELLTPDKRKAKGFEAKPDEIKLIEAYIKKQNEEKTKRNEKIFYPHKMPSNVLTIINKYGITPTDCLNKTYKGATKEEILVVEQYYNSL